MKETQTIGEFLLMVFGKFFKQYFESLSTRIEKQNEEMLYLITIILKIIHFEKKVNLDYLSLDKAQLIKKVKSITEINSFIVFCKLSMILNLNEDNDQTFIQ